MTQQELIDALNRLGYGVSASGPALYARWYGRFSQAEAQKILDAHAHSIGGSL